MCCTHPDWRILWAKSEPRYPLWRHLLDTAAVSMELPLASPDCTWSLEQTAFLIGLHDIGKADPCFQHQDWTDAQGNRRNFSDELELAGFQRTGDARCRHERVSARFIQNILASRGVSQETADAVSRAIAAHHGYWDEGARLVLGAYECARMNLCQMLERRLGIHDLPCESPVDMSAFGVRLAGRLVLCDWIASNERFTADPRLADLDDPELYFPMALQVAREFVGELRLERDADEGRPECLVDTPRPIQQVLLDEDIPPGLVVIEAPMGEGKTEASWILAEKWRARGYHGVYMALPTMATSDSLYVRYNDDYLGRLHSREIARLVHGMAWLRDCVEPDREPRVGEPGDDRSLAAAWFRPTRRAMLAAHGVGTVDQAMLAGMNVRFGFLRLYGLTDRVLVIDEVHAYDAYMSAIIARLLNWCACLRIPVVLLSATLSAGQRAAMIEAYRATGGDPGPEAPYPLITVAAPGGEARTIPAEASSHRTLRIETHSGLLGDARRTAEIATRLVEDGGCCCVILNTVRQAQEVYTELGLPDTEKLLFHARFTAADRERITRRVLDLFGRDRSHRPTKFVLVATQVVEQSLDVDFDHMISEIAPIDLLLQRSGRLHRHQSRSCDPTLHVLLPETERLSFGSTSRVYAEKPLLRTLAILSSDFGCELRLPSDFRMLVETCYGDAEWQQDAVDWERIRNADREWDGELETIRCRGNEYVLLQPAPRHFCPVRNEPVGLDTDDGNGWRACTRLGANDRTAILVPQDTVEQLSRGELEMEDVRELYRNALKLPGYLPVENPVRGYGAGVEAEGRLHGLLLLPTDNEGLWRGATRDGNHYEAAYDPVLGLTVRRV